MPLTQASAHIFDDADSIIISIVVSWIIVTYILEMMYISVLPSVLIMELICFMLHSVIVFFICKLIIMYLQIFPEIENRGG